MAHAEKHLSGETLLAREFVSATLAAAQISLVADALHMEEESGSGIHRRAQPTRKLLNKFIESAGRVPVELDRLAQHEAFRVRDLSDTPSPDGLGNAAMTLQHFRSRVANMAPAVELARTRLQTLPPDDSGTSTETSGETSGETTGTETTDSPIDASGQPISPLDALLIPVSSFPRPIQHEARPSVPPTRESCDEATRAQEDAVSAGTGSSDYTNFNNIITGIIIGAAAALGGWVGACLAAACAEFLPRMLAAFEDFVSNLFG